MTIDKNDVPSNYSKEVLSVFDVTKTPEEYRESIKDGNLFIISLTTQMLKKGGEYEAMFPAIAGLASSVAIKDIERNQELLTEKEVQKIESELTPKQIEDQEKAINKLNRASESLMQTIFPDSGIRTDAEFRLPKGRTQHSLLHEDRNKKSEPQMNATLAAPGQQGTYFVSSQNDDMFQMSQKGTLSLKENLSPSDIEIIEAKSGEVAFYTSWDAKNKGIAPFKEGELNGSKHTSPFKKEDTEEFLKKGELNNQEYLSGRRMLAASFSAPRYSEKETPPSSSKEEQEKVKRSNSNNNYKQK